MEPASPRFALWLGKRLSLVLAVTFLVFMVLQAQERTRPLTPEPSTSEEPGVREETVGEEREPVFLPSSKSGVLHVPKEPIFLPSSKSGVIVPPKPKFFSTSKSLEVDSLPKDVLRTLTEKSSSASQGER